MLLSYHFVRYLLTFHFEALSQESFLVSLEQLISFKVFDKTVTELYFCYIFICLILLHICS